MQNKKSRYYITLLIFKLHFIHNILMHNFPPLFPKIQSNLVFPRESPPIPIHPVRAHSDGGNPYQIEAHTNYFGNYVYDGIHPWQMHFQNGYHFGEMWTSSNALFRIHPARVWVIWLNQKALLYVESTSALQMNIPKSSHVNHVRFDMCHR